MTEPQMNLHSRNCLRKTDLLTDNHLPEDLTTNSMSVRDAHHLPYIGDFPPEPSSRKDVSCSNRHDSNS